MPYYYNQASNPWPSTPQPQMYNQSAPTAPAMSNTFYFVQGQAAAEAYLLAPGQSVILMDSNAPVIYYKSADASGRYLPMKTYDLVERKPEDARTPQIDTSSFVKRDEIADLIKQEIEKLNPLKNE